MENTFQLKHEEILNQKHRLDIILIAENLISPANYGMMLRTAEAFGVKKVIFITNEHNTLSTKMKRSARSAEKYLAVEFEQDSEQVLCTFRHQGYQLLALERTNDSVSVHQFSTDSRKMVLVVGNESWGVSENALKKCDASIEIPMYGQNSSMNVVVATGIALSTIVK